MEAACGHTKVKEITWYENHGQSSKFMCLDCNTDFIPLTPDIREFLFHKQWEEDVAKAHEPYGGMEKAHPAALSPQQVNLSRAASRARHGVDCSCSSC